MDSTCWIHKNTSAINDVTENLYLRNPKFTLGKLGIQLLFLKQFQNCLKILHCHNLFNLRYFRCIILNDPSFFLTKKTRAPQGEELGLMKPFSESSYSCSDNSFILDRTNRYGAQATGAAPGIKSIWNSTGRIGERPDKSSGNTSKDILQAIVRPERTRDAIRVRIPDACPLFFCIPITYTHLVHSPNSLCILILQLWTISLEMYWSSTFKTTIPFGICPIALLSISTICVARTHAVAGKVPYLVALVALLSTQAIVMKMAIGALGKRSLIRLLLTSPHIVDLGNILPLKVLIVTMVCFLDESSAFPFVSDCPYPQ
ncbi:hypothetical protein Tco_0045680 [Tanacetum coccineum]